MISHRSSRTVAALALTVAMTATLVACGDAAQGVTAGRSDEIGGEPGPGPEPTTEPPPETVPASTNPNNPLEPTEDTTPPPPTGEGIIDFGDNKPPQPYDNFLNAAFADITQFWADNYESLYGAPFEPVAAIYAHYPERSDLPESCQGGVGYADVELNAFYTTCGDIIVYDDFQLLPGLVDKLGAAAVGVVAAHEYGHAIQARSGVFDLDLPTVDTEQQADCFAGAWAAHVARGESDTLAFGDSDVKGGVIAMIEVRDPPGIDVVADPSGHGSAFDRVGAFQEGFINGITRCADFIDNPYPRVDLVFTAEEEVTGGNLPLDEIILELPPAFDTMWVPTLEASSVAFTPPTLVPFTIDGGAPDCDGLTIEQLQNDATFCASSNTIAYDDLFVRDLYSRFGDFAFSYPLAVAYSDAVQAALGSTLAGEPRELLNDCLVGAWVIDIVPSGDFDPDGFPIANNPNQVITLSAGDLDEAVITAVALGDEASDTNVLGTAFEKIDAFRAGVLGGMSACQSRIG
jgi:predicted metalloprotease